MVSNTVKIETGKIETGKTKTDKTRRVLLLTTPQSYRTPAFLEAAGRLGIEVLQAVDMPQRLAEEWKLRLGVDFQNVSGATDRVVDFVSHHPVDAVLPLDDSGALLAAEISHRLGLPHNAPEAAEAARDKSRMRQMLSSGGVASPRHHLFHTDEMPVRVAEAVEKTVDYPCVVKPVDLNGSRGVIRADNRQDLLAAVERLYSLIGASPARPFLVESYIPGTEVALEGLLNDGALHVLALFDKPDPLVGPFFEETIYVTPSRLPISMQEAIARCTAQAARSIGLEMGPIHAELRINEEGPWIVEVAGRSIGGLCSRMLRFGTGSTLEELILCQACSLPIQSMEREQQAGGVMMIPIPEAGILHKVSGVESAEAVSGIESVQITAKLNNPIEPLPEGDSYLGFIFARSETPAQVEQALRAAHRKLQFHIQPEFALLAR